jgi:hypothetical protein
MNPIFNNSINPLQEHLIKHDTIRKQNSLIGYCIAFSLGLIVCYVVMKTRSQTERLLEKRESVKSSIISEEK